VSLQEILIFLLERLLAVMLFVTLHVFANRRELRQADAKGCVPTLPFESSGVMSLFIDPLRRVCLGQANDVRNGYIGRDANKQMDVIGHTADGVEHTLLAAKNSADVGVENVAQLGCDQRLPVLGAEDDAVDQLRVGSCDGCSSLSLVVLVVF
jgi:hypothetical protein